MKYWNKVYDAEVAGTSDVVLKQDLSEFERMAKQHDNRQPFIEQELIEAIKAGKKMDFQMDFFSMNTKKMFFEFFH